MPVELRDTYLFTTLTDGQLAQVRDLSRGININEDEVLFECGSPANRFFLMLSGQIKLSRLSMNGDEKVIGIINPGNTFAEALMFQEQPSYPVTATAIKKTELLGFDNQQFSHMLRDSVDSCFRMMGDMSQRLRSLIKEIDDLTLQSATNRVAGLLYRYRSMRDMDTFTLDAPKGILASRLSVKPETFSRILHDLSYRKIIRVKGNQITILNHEGLCELAHEDAHTEFNKNINIPPGRICPLTGDKRCR
ncbi:Nitric oxide -responding transcriptional regulator Dnr (Crp/Fnr family) [hydrothermal vent metagenome]|uniref:Nitric oxide -responding transcriptional regulator Dnr (Crp/Fnr family) n=1 Tax=hydrothermal vent metagenome TaxID=652676 RepID=A0A3B1B2B8_9ZZZZ